jgi:hypothetical protein
VTGVIGAGSVVFEVNSDPGSSADFQCFFHTATVICAVDVVIAGVDGERLIVFGGNFA